VRAFKFAKMFMEKDVFASLVGVNKNHLERVFGKCGRLDYLVAGSDSGAACNHSDPLLAQGLLS
jgi:hypothetical protein